MIFQAVQSLRPSGSFEVRDENLVWKGLSSEKPTEEEIQAKITELKNAEPMRVLREERDQRLAKTDWRASSDLTLSSEWATYRQALRDLPANSTPSLDNDNNLTGVTWPTEPT